MGIPDYLFVGKKSSEFCQVFNEIFAPVAPYFCGSIILGNTTTYNISYHIVVAVFYRLTKEIT